MSSLRLRLLAGAVIGIAIALSLAGIVLVRIFDAHVRHRYVKELDDHLLQIVATLEAGGAGGLRLKQELSEPEFRRPFSGHYWQVMRDGEPVLRSRSLWDETLRLRTDPPTQSDVPSYEVAGPLHKRVVVVERVIELPPPVAAALRIAVAGESGVIDQARREFASVVGLSLLILGTLLSAASWLQVGAGLAPLHELRQRLEHMRTGAAERLEGNYPAEVVGLVCDLNRLIETQAAEAERVRRNAATLGHGLKTPLAVLAAEARALQAKGEGSVAEVIEGEVGAMNAQVARALASARAIGPRAQPGTRTDIAAVIDRLVTAMRKLSVDAPAAWSVSVSPGVPPVPIDRRDVEDMLGNLLDNARKWARSRVNVVVRVEEGNVVVVIFDDGPGIPPERMHEVLARGTRLDRTMPGTGVGLSIVKDLTELNGCKLTLVQGQSGGLQAELRLPSSDSN